MVAAAFCPRGPGPPEGAAEEDMMRKWSKAALTAATLAVSLGTIAPHVQAEEVVADLQIRRVRLTAENALRVRAVYECPEGFTVVTRSGIPGAYAYVQQQSDSYQSSGNRKFAVTCDGTSHRIVIRFRDARHYSPDGTSEWERGVLTSVRMQLTAYDDGFPEQYVFAGDQKVVIL
jgi:hypothetical protein